MVARVRTRQREEVKLAQQHVESSRDGGQARFQRGPPLISPTDRHLFVLCDQSDSRSDTRGQRVRYKCCSQYMHVAADRSDETFAFRMSKRSFFGPVSHLRVAGASRDLKDQRVGRPAAANIVNKTISSEGRRIIGAPSSVTQLIRAAHELARSAAAFWQKRRAEGFVELSQRKTQSSLFAHCSARCSHVQGKELKFADLIIRSH